ncbi:hypothetical protein LTR82_017792 [Friedmanniomyces endolithicus]|uniref:Uncharacterized protein n=1 Tax=Friedmanniomyces endolithicus TaxID=329885 RepID=A0AAN6J400_9PEZI|nr:hypothetical protein LTR82_017792 [Friedmanniomyces endolithicus]
MTSSLYQIFNNNSPGWVFYLIIPVVQVIYLVFETVSKRSRNYPDGPKSSPLVGNMFNVSVPYLHLKLTEWSRKYGDFFAFTMASTAVVVLSSPDVLNDLIVKKGQKYSSRPLPSPQAALFTQNARIVNMPCRLKPHKRPLQQSDGTIIAVLLSAH